MDETREFTEWLRTTAEPHWRYRADAERPVLTVGVVEKSSCSGFQKGRLIDKLIGHTVFCGRYEPTKRNCIDVFFSPFHQVVFLYVNSYNDGHRLLGYFDGTENFFEVIREAESQFLKNLFTVFILCHIVVFIQPDTRLDTSLVRQLIAINEMRPRYSKKMMQQSKLPRVWQDESRLALPRLLFIMHENRVKRGSVMRPGHNFQDLSTQTERMERSREYQFVHILKREHLIAEHLGIALASLSPHRIPFVHVVDPSESESNIIQDCLLHFCRGDVSLDGLSLIMEQNLQAQIDGRISSVEFLMGHIRDIGRKESKQSFFFLIPTLADFADGARASLDALSDPKILSDEKLADWIGEESHFEHDMISQVSRAATDLYKCLIGDGRELSTVFYNPDLSQAKHLKSMHYVAAFIRLMLTDSQIQKAWPKVMKRCKLLFKSSVNCCDVQSVTKLPCQLLPHKIRGVFIPDQSMDESLKGRCYSHFSGYSHLSACNCGQSQRLRNDPFDAKEANYDFYSQFSCCSKKENMPFKLYNPGIKWDVSSTEVMVMKKPEAMKSRGVKILSRKRIDSESGDRPHDSYFISKPKTKHRIVNELSWQYNKMCSEHAGKYLPHMWFNKVANESPNTGDNAHPEPNRGHVLPLYPSWSVVCVGSSRLYVHASGLKDQPGFWKGSEFLLPWDVVLTVKSERWFSGLREILRVDKLPWREKRIDEDAEQGTHKEKVKLFVGFEYECPQGHRFFCDKPQNILHHDRNNGILRTDAEELVKSNLPIYTKCKCSKSGTVNAQLMRLHLVTPKAPVGVRLVPMVMLDETGYFHMGQVAELTHARYYILRLPFVYQNRAQLFPKPVDAPTTLGTLLANSVQVYPK